MLLSCFHPSSRTSPPGLLPSQIGLFKSYTGLHSSIFPSALPPSLFLFLSISLSLSLSVTPTPAPLSLSFQIKSPISQTRACTHTQALLLSGPFNDSRPLRHHTFPVSPAFSAFFSFSKKNSCVCRLIGPRPCRQSVLVCRPQMVLSITSACFGRLVLLMKSRTPPRFSDESEL